MTYTVISLVDSTGEVLANQIEADDPHAAMAQEAASIKSSDSYALDDVQVICAIEGEHAIMPPCEDAGKAAYASDLIRIVEDL